MWEHLTLLGIVCIGIAGHAGGQPPCQARSLGLSAFVFYILPIPYDVFLPLQLSHHEEEFVFQTLPFLLLLVVLLSTASKKTNLLYCVIHSYTHCYTHQHTQITVLRHYIMVLFTSDEHNKIFSIRCNTAEWKDIWEPLNWVLGTSIRVPGIVIECPSLAIEGGVR